MAKMKTLLQLIADLDKAMGERVDIAALRNRLDHLRQEAEVDATTSQMRGNQFECELDLALATMDAAKPQEGGETRG